MSEWERHQEAEAMLKESGVTIQHLYGNRAFYRPSNDSITLPLREQFPSADN
jgi:putative DNA primase/helicase